MAALTIICGGCSGGKPSEGDGRSYIEQAIKSQSGGCIRLASFRKTDGQLHEAFGQHGYELSYEAEIEFTKDCYWGPFSFGQWSGGFFATPGKPQSEMDNFSPAFMGRIAAAKGSKTKITGVIRFMKTEQGWHIVHID